LQRRGNGLLGDNPPEPEPTVTYFEDTGSEPVNGLQVGYDGIFREIDEIVTTTYYGR